MTKETKDAIKAAYNAMNDNWKRAAWTYFCQYAEQHSLFLTKDVNAWAKKEKDFDSPRGGKAWGAIALLAQKLKIVEKDKLVNSAHAHGSTVTRWRSLIK